MLDEATRAGRKILVVEDEVLICVLIETILEDAGYQTITAGSLAEAIREIERGPIDLAILDLNVKGQKVYPVAEKLAAAAIPFIFATGSGGVDLTGFEGRPTVQKPFQEAQLLAEVARSLN